MSASIQTTINFTAPLDSSHAVSLFRNLPRWPGAQTSFDLTWSYLRGNALTALVPIIAAILLTLIFAFLVTLRYTCLQKRIDERIQLPTSPARQITFSILLTTPAIIFIAIALSSLTSIQFSANDGLDVITAVIRDISRTGFAVVDIALYMRDKLLSFNPADVAPSLPNPGIPDFVQPAMEAIAEYMKNNFPDVEGLQQSLVVLVDRIDQALNVLRKAVDITFGVLAAIIVLLLSGPLLLAFEDALPISTKSRPCRIIGHILFLLLPALMAWVLVGLSSGVGTVVADVCVMLNDYRGVVRGELSSADVPDNALVKADFLCSGTLDADKIREQLSATVDSLVQSELAKDTIEIVLNTSASSIAEAAEWSRDAVTPYVDCSRIQTFLGKLEFAVCAARGHSAIQGIFDLWICLLGLAIVMSVALAASLFGFRVAWALIAWPRGKKDKVERFRGQRVDLSKLEAQEAK